MPYAAGTCKRCGGEPRPDRRTCQACADEQSEKEAAQRDARRKAGVCLMPGCNAHVAKTKLAGGATRKRVPKPAKYCRKHLNYYAERERAAALRSS